MEGCFWGEIKPLWLQTKSDCMFSAWVLAYNAFELSLSFLGLDLFADYITWEKDFAGPWLAWVIWSSAARCRSVGLTLAHSTEPEPDYLHKKGSFYCRQQSQIYVYSWLFHCSFSFSCAFHGTNFLGIMYSVGNKGRRRESTATGLLPQGTLLACQKTHQIGIGLTFIKPGI